VLPHLIERGTGKIINISSIGGRKGGRGRGAYRATKAGLISFTETLAAEVYQHGIRVNCICPGGVETEMIRQVTQGDVPSNLMHPDEIAQVALFLASEDSSAITGTAVDAFGATNPLFQPAWRAPRR
jgi:NAD(P)-dependent dehydrogenase (short-subunit alcohol dehydrogenase family)